MIICSDPFQVCFSNIKLRFIPPAPVQLSADIATLLCDDKYAVDAEYEIRLLTDPLQVSGHPLYVCEGMALYKTQEGWLRVFSPQFDESRCQVACLLCPNAKNVLYIHAPLWDQLSRPLNCFHLIGLEDVLLRRNAFLLHSSVVMHQGKAVLFCGPSGTGKSTQAKLWNEHLGAQILNGDRCVIMQKDDGFYGGGSPLAGSSGIYRKEQAPIAGIFLISHGEQNSISRLGFDAFPSLFSQTLVNSWDTDFMDRIIDLYQKLFEIVPIYHFECLPDVSAVERAYQLLF